jgi:molecular chaperone GrpE (heat shock protein)
MPAHHNYSARLLASGRHRFERTDESVASIAADFGIRATSMHRLAKRLGWVRYERRPRDLPAAACLLAQAEELEAAAHSLEHRPEERAGPSCADDSSLSAARMEEGEVAVQAPAAPADELPPFSNAVERLYRAVLEELSAVENLRTRLKREPLSAIDAERTARTVSSLTETLQKLQRLQCAAPQSGSFDDDMPADIDEFRRELARRIEIFVASRTNVEDGGDSAASPPLDAVQ